MFSQTFNVFWFLISFLSLSPVISEQHGLSGSKSDTQLNSMLQIQIKCMAADQAMFTNEKKSTKVTTRERIDPLDTQWES